MIIKEGTDSQYNSQYSDDDSLRNLFFLVAKFAKRRPKDQLNVVQILSLHIYNYNNCPMVFMMKLINLSTRTCIYLYCYKSLVERQTRS